MCINLRKVKFRLGQMSYEPDITDEELTVQENECQEQDGFFHQWVNDVDTSKDIPYVKTKALVEDKDGKLHEVDYCLLQFV